MSVYVAEATFATRARPAMSGDCESPISALRSCRLDAPRALREAMRVYLYRSVPGPVNMRREWEIVAVWDCGVRRRVQAIDA